MHKDATTRPEHSPLEKVMMDIKDTSMDIWIIADWLRNLEQSQTNTSRAQLKICSDKLAATYDKLRELTGAHPCK